LFVRGKPLARVQTQSTTHAQPTVALHNNDLRVRSMYPRRNRVRKPDTQKVRYAPSHRAWSVVEGIAQESMIQRRDINRRQTHNADHFGAGNITQRSSDRQSARLANGSWCTPAVAHSRSRAGGQAPCPWPSRAAPPTAHPPRAMRSEVADWSTPTTRSATLPR